VTARRRDVEKAGDRGITGGVGVWECRRDGKDVGAGSAGRGWISGIGSGDMHMLSSFSKTDRRSPAHPICKNADAEINLHLNSEFSNHGRIDLTQMSTLKASRVIALSRPTDSRKRTSRIQIYVRNRRLRVGADRAGATSPAMSLVTQREYVDSHFGLLPRVFTLTLSTRSFEYC
jgi:hypothetical protein